MKKETKGFFKTDIAKKLTLAILAIGFIVGSVGSWFEIFNMDKYTSFMTAFTPMYLGLIVSIGSNSAVEKIKEAKEK